ncbi:hypothetical protein D9M68_141870 [compost metagenome]
MTSEQRFPRVMPDRSRGFVLVGVVWFLAIMTLLAAAAVLWVERAVIAADERGKALRQEVEARALMARVEWLVATQSYTVAGLTLPNGGTTAAVDMDTSVLPVGGELPLDGRQLCMTNGWCLTLIDQAARLSLSGIDPRLLASLLVGLGVSADQVPVMVAQWLDYLHPGVAPQLGAANEVTGRMSQDLLRRRPLRSVMEVFRLTAWQPWEDHLLGAGWTELVTTDEAALNINTADARVLSLAWGLPAGAVEQLLKARRARPLLQMSDLRDVLGAYAGRVPEDGWARLASSTLSIRLYPAGSAQATEYEVRFSSDHRLLPPWQLLLKRSVKINDRISIPPLAADAAPGILAAPLVASPR